MLKEGRKGREGKGREGKGREGKGRKEGRVAWRVGGQADGQTYRWADRQRMHPLFRNLV